MPNAFIPKKHDANLNNIKWDKYYIDRVLKDKVVKTGDGDDDYSIVKVVVEDKKLISEVIAEQSKDVGLVNILNRFAQTGDESILPQSVNVNGGEVIDMTQLPHDLIDADIFYKQQKAMFDSLPKEVTKGRSFTEFMTNFNQAEFDAYVAALAAAQAAAAKPKEEDGGTK